MEPSEKAEAWKQEVRALYPDLKEDSPPFDAAVILIACVEVGFEPEASEKVSLIAAGLIAAGITPERMELAVKRISRSALSNNVAEPVIRSVLEHIVCKMDEQS